MGMINEVQLAKAIGFLPEAVENRHLSIAAKALTFWGIEFFYNGNYDIKNLDKYLFFHPALENYWLLFSNSNTQDNRFSGDGFLLYAVQSFAIASALNFGRDALHNTQQCIKLNNLIKSVSILPRQLFVGTLWYVFLLKIFENDSLHQNYKTRKNIIESAIEHTLRIIKSDVNVVFLKRDIIWSDGNYQSQRCNYLNVASMNYSLSIVEKVFDAYIKFNFNQVNKIDFSYPFISFIEGVCNGKHFFETGLESESYYEIAHRLSADIRQKYPQLVANHSRQMLTDKNLFIAQYQEKKFLFRLKKIIF
ncbi:MAG TPA: hypothetical protein PKC96_06530 [Bacilli bacterium]|nr:hypothetical protein [Bacilli bacterium]